jgi:hypothetical protein
MPKDIHKEAAGGRPVDGGGSLLGPGCVYWLLSGGVAVVVHSINQTGPLRTLKSFRYVLSMVILKLSYLMCSV